MLEHALIYPGHSSLTFLIAFDIDHNTEISRSSTSVKPHIPLPLTTPGALYPPRPELQLQVLCSGILLDMENEGWSLLLNVLKNCCHVISLKGVELYLHQPHIPPALPVPPRAYIVMPQLAHFMA